MSQPTRPTETTDQKGDAKDRHTPGPWHSASRPEGPNGAGRIWYYAKREPSLSSSCFSIGPFRTQQEAVAESNRQNSLLLMRSAAPDLLAACKAAELVDRHSADCKYTTEQLERDMADLGWVYDQHGPVGFYPGKLLRAAIAKAEGGAA